VRIPTKKVTKIHPSSLKDYLPSPSGYLHKTCIYDVGNNANAVKESDGSFSVTKEDGSHLRIPPCKYPRLVVKSGKQQIDGSGWQVFTIYNAGSDLTSFNGTWNVPTDPASNHGQLLYTFTGLQNNFFDGEQTIDIIQPVLQYGASPAGGGYFWGIASWYVTSSGVGLHSTLQNVTSGDSILGTMAKSSATSQNWAIVATDTNSKVTTKLTVNTKVAKLEPDAFVTLEVYSVTDCSQYPTDSLNYVNLAVDVSDKPVTPTWKVCSQQQICNEAATVVSPTAVTINY